MIDEQTKAAAIAKLLRQVPSETVAKEYQLPLPLVNEWRDNLDERDIIALESNIQAVATVMEGGIVPGQEQLLKFHLENAGMEVAREVEKAAAMGDPMHSKSLQLCADAVCKLYQTLVMKSVGLGLPGAPMNTTGLSQFQSLMKD